MYEDIYPKKKKKTIVNVDSGEEYEVDIGSDGRVIKKPKNRMNLIPKGQTINRKPSKKAVETMKRAMRIRRYIKQGEKNKE